jgi:hypothetical protein
MIEFSGGGEIFAGKALFPRKSRKYKEFSAKKIFLFFLF